MLWALWWAPDSWTEPFNSGASWGYVQVIAFSASFWVTLLCMQGMYRLAGKYYQAICENERWESYFEKQQAKESELDALLAAEES